MLKMTTSPNKPAPSKNDDNKPASGRNNGNSKVDEFGGNSMEHAKKSGKSKDEKSAKSQKLSKSGKLKGKKSKKLSKSWNSPNFNTIEVGPSFLTLNARTIFNCLRLTFTKALIFWHFDPECHIRIETNTLGYAINGVLSQLISETNPNGVVNKTDLGQ